MGGCQNYGTHYGNIRVILGLYRGSMGDSGEENGNYYNGFNGWLSKSWSFFGYPEYSVPYCNRDPKRDHDFDNHPYSLKSNGLLHELSFHFSV